MPDLLGRNLHKVSPPHPFFQRCRNRMHHNQLSSRHVTIVQLFEQGQFGIAQVGTTV
jgi:hypothetical protein